jgi:hypothetical protein
LRNTIHPPQGFGEDCDAWCGRNERATFQLCRPGGAHPGAASVAHDPSGSQRGVRCLDGEFEAHYTDFGRPSIALERLIRASLIQILS